MASPTESENTMPDILIKRGSNRETVCTELTQLVEEMGLPGVAMPICILMDKEKTLNVTIPTPEAITDTIFAVLGELNKSGDFVAHILPALAMNAGLLIVIGIRVNKHMVTHTPGNC